ncbi:VOC family protein [Nocardioides sp. S-58]|uniref:VOC family protein n=1 Tax=Nocardioides renjunii TaxID=3095075 RepID=A0ABU5KBD6_9ACTN|nr:VOC family protein [Nocardioides sp. S-58]MDZ5662279.1 VOC family protein [Nocardioides sp. S-58]
METQQRTYPAGVTSWVDLEQPDLGATQAFYGGLFGWQFEVVGGGEYVIARLDGRDAAGLGEGDGDGSAWTTYVAVDDADATTARVAAAGGTVVEPVGVVGSAGRMAVVDDPAGARFRLWEAGHRLGAQVTNAPGSWNFSDLHGVDADTVERFYADVFGWVVTDVGFGRMIRRPGYGDHVAATVDPGIHERQAGVSVPDGFADAIGWIVARDPEESPHWHVTFTVADRDAAAADVVRLGGTVLASDDTDWTRTARVRDPQGAQLTLSQFSPPSG